MATKKRKKRSPKPTQADYERWIKMLEQGLTKEEAAKKADVDIRTFRKYLPKAYENREARLARRELIGNALAEHQTTLIKRLESIADGVGVPSHQHITPASRFHGTAQVMTLANVRVNGKTYEVQQFDEDPELGLLIEHLADQRQLWADYRRFKELNLDYVDLCIQLGKSVAEDLEEQTGLQKQNSNGEGYSEPMIFTLIGAAIDRVAGTEDVVRPRLDLIGDVDPGSLRWGGHQLARDNPEKLEKARTFFHSKLKELETDVRVQDIADGIEVMENLGKDIRDAVTELLLFRYIGSQCRACDRYGLVG